MTQPEHQSTILIVDDEAANLGVLFEHLGEDGFTVLLAEDGAGALRRVAWTTPDMILLDIKLPDMDGFELCRRMKALPQLAEKPFMFLTALDDTQAIQKGLDLSAVDYIIKPFHPQEVCARIKTHLTLRTLRQQLEEQNRELREQNVRFQALAEATPEGIVIHESGRVLAVNTRLSEMFGYAREELIGRNVREFVAPASIPLLEEHLRAPSDRLYELEGRKRDGTIFPLEVSGRSIPYQGRQARVAIIRDLTRSRALEQENRILRISGDSREQLGCLVGKSLLMRNIYEQIEQAAHSAETVIISGETGTGKELAARTIFELSDHHTREFVYLNCGALPANLFEAQLFGHRKGAFTGADADSIGYIEQAQDGVLFLDEIGDLPSAMQVKLLHVLNNRTYAPIGSTKIRQADTRIIAATNKNLHELVRTGAMRADFFHRLHVITLNMPPLRLHKEDIPLLCRHFFEQQSAPGKRPPAAILDQLMAYHWPGNVRELMNVLRRYLVTGICELSGDVMAHDAPSARSFDDMIPDRPLSDMLDAYERHILTTALTHCGGNKSRVAERLGLPRKSLQRKLKRLGLE